MRVIDKKDQNLVLPACGGAAAGEPEPVPAEPRGPAAGRLESEGLQLRGPGEPRPVGPDY